MTDVPAASETPPTARPPTDATPSVRCSRCGYDLEGLSPDALCPECGSPIALALRGRLLEYSSPEYVAALHRGVFLVLVAIIGQIIATVANILGAILISAAHADPTSLLELMRLVFFALSLLLLYGWWQLSTPDPASAEGERGETPRRVVRALVITAVLVNLCSILLYALPIRYATLAVSILGFFVFAGRFFAEMLYIRWLAPRIPHDRVYRRASTLLWLGPLLYTVGLALLGLGPLIALVLYWNMLDWMRKDLKGIRACVAQEATA